MRIYELLFVIFAGDIEKSTVLGNIWSDWWTYSGVSGPDVWGEANKAWIVCKKGKYQSPINIEPKYLVHDPNLTQLNISHNKINCLMINTGQDLKCVSKDLDDNPFVFTGGPLSYKYTLYELKIHFGVDNNKGSEHSIGGKKFPLEIQLYGFNGEIHKNSTQALNSPNGIAVISVLALASDKFNKAFDILATSAQKVHYKGSSTVIEGFSVKNIIPPIDYFVTYEGSITQPGCMETVTWVILNKPLHISNDQLELLRHITTSNGLQRPLVTNNFRSITPTHGRLVRTNIKSKGKDEECYTTKITSYEVNKQFKNPKQK